MVMLFKHRKVHQSTALLAIHLDCNVFVSDIFSLVSKDTDVCIKARQYQTSAYGSADFSDHWYRESDTFENGTV